MQIRKKTLYIWCVVLVVFLIGSTVSFVFLSKKIKEKREMERLEAAYEKAVAEEYSEDDDTKDDGGNRKYIIVQWDEPVKSGSEAENQGFKTIDEISRERIKRAADQIGDTSGFKHYKLAKVADDLILDKIDEFDPNKTNLLSDDMVSPFSGEALGIGVNASGLDTLLTTWMVDDGFPINTKVEEFKFGNYIAYSPHGSRRLYFILDGWDSDATRDLLNNIGRNEISVQTIILYNYSFSFTTLTELKNNLKSVLDDDKKIEIIERF